jgi:uncharacterized membrane protein YgcG
MVAMQVGIGLLLGVANAARELPPTPFGAPQYYVIDEPKALPPATLSAIQRLLTEHDRVNDEQIGLAIFSSAGGEDPEAFAARAFNEWKVGQRGKDNGALVSIFVEERSVVLNEGAGLEAALGEEQRSEITGKARSQLRRGDAARAAALGVLGVLEALGSPLMSSGNATGLLQFGGMGDALVEETAPEDSSYGWWLWFALGSIFLGGVFFLMTSADAHFTSGGWFRPSPWRWARWKHELGQMRKRGGLGGSHGAW